MDHVVQVSRFSAHGLIAATLLVSTWQISGWLRTKMIYITFAFVQRVTNLEFSLATIH